VLSSMSVGLAAGLLVSGALADDYGRRRVFVLAAGARGELVLGGGRLGAAFVLASGCAGGRRPSLVASAGVGRACSSRRPGRARATGSGAPAVAPVSPPVRCSPRPLDGRSLAGGRTLLVGLATGGLGGRPAAARRVPLEPPHRVACRARVLLGAG